ncbi:hypothetical protein CAEBREN_29218 [Caenorhabditis brenneri]|uniref:Domain of unknown function DB domain-containing protein n=1 Tax=Caenorhabditis brenneri TaxID=135651 RepID=G0NR86_CAEBE|nr:hypothetical protein CAEBREN_29218 [Caenorhabditis brenneri]
MSVSTIRAISILLLLASYTLADLPSCARAKCVHCAVDFIDRMCPTACAGCKTPHQSIQAVNIQRPPQPPPAFNTQPQFTQSVNTRQISNEGGAQVQRPQFQPQVQTQQQPQQPLLNIPLQPHAQPVQFAAPVYQGNQIPYPQNQIQTATLAPLVEPPKVSSFDPNLSRQPADLAQPLPEYQTGQIQYPQQAPIQSPFPQQQQGFGLPQAPQQQGYGQQVDNIFNQPNPFQLPTPPQQPQGLFGAPGAATGGQQAQQQAAFNPFQPFLQQTNAALDPFNLFNLNANPLTVNQQGISTLQTQQQQYGQVQHQGNYNQNYNQQPQQPPQVPQPSPPQQPQQQQQYNYNQQYQQFQQPQQQQYNNQQQQQRPQQPQQNQYNQQPQQQQYGQQPQQQQQYQNQNNNNNNNYQQQTQQTAPQQAQLPVAPQQQVQQPIPQQPLPQPVAASVDSRPVNFEKYVDPGKGTPLAPPPQAQCPRQPGWQPCITKDTANDRFRNCCARLGEGCAPLCNYDATLATMQLAVLTGRCPLAKVGDVMICASGYQDASQCCEAYGKEDF